MDTMAMDIVAASMKESIVAATMVANIMAATMVATGAIIPTIRMETAARGIFGTIKPDIAVTTRLRTSA